MHAFGHPDEEGAILGFVDAEGGFADDLVALFGVDEGLLVGGIHVVEPEVEVEVGALAEHGAPLVEVVVADGLLALLVGDDGEDEVEVGVGQLVELEAGSAMAAGVGIGAVGAVEVAGVGEGQGEGASTRTTCEEAGVGDDAAARRLGEAGLEFVLTNDVVEVHT